MTISNHQLLVCARTSNELGQFLKTFFDRDLLRATQLQLSVTVTSVAIPEGFDEISASSWVGRATTPEEVANLKAASRDGERLTHRFGLVFSFKRRCGLAQLENELPYIKSDELDMLFPTLLFLWRIEIRECRQDGDDSESGPNFVDLEFWSDFLNKYHADSVERSDYYNGGLSIGAWS